MKLISFALTAAFVLLVTSTSADADGAVDLNQDCAEAGCFAGDGPGFPILISVPGHYRLSSHLVTPPGQAAINIQVPNGDVTLDLNGYAVRGPFTCTGFPVTGCAGAGTATVGVTINVKGGSLRGGTIVGYGLRGLDLTTRGAYLIESMTFTENGGGGADILMQSGAVGVTTRNSRFIRNGSDGYVDALGGNLAGRVEHSYFFGNFGAGARSSSGSLTHSFFQFNGGPGAIGHIGGCQVTHSALLNNNGGGVQLQSCSGIGNVCNFAAC